MNQNILEICWIVDKRNKWAKERKKLRNKLYRSEIDNKSTEEECENIKLEFNRHNYLRIVLNQHTRRLKSLLKQENLKLISDKNAGYCAIVPSHVDMPNFLIKRTPWGQFDKEHIADLAMSFEAMLALEKIIGG